jgi:transcriptional antiterminator RfaH
MDDVDIWHATNWFAVQCKPYGEPLGAARVERLDLEVFLPRMRQQRQVCGVRRLVTKALFPGYFFACFSPLVSLNAVRAAPGVLRVVGTARLPLPLAPEIIASLRDRIGPDGFVELAPRGLRPGDRVRVEEGPFAGWLGRVEQEADDHRRVLILLEALQPARLWLDESSVEVATESP